MAAVPKPRPRKKVVAQNRTDLVAAMDMFAAAKQVKDEVLAEYAKAEEALVQIMQEHGVKSVTGTEAKGTLIEGTRIVIDEAALKKRLGAGMWDKITKQVIDKEKLEARIAVGDIPATAVAVCSEEFPNKPYVRVTKARK